MELAFIAGVLSIVGFAVGFALTARARQAAVQRQCERDEAIARMQHEAHGRAADGAIIARVEKLEAASATHETRLRNLESKEVLNAPRGRSGIVGRLGGG